MTMLSNDDPILLIGYRGTGKSSVARELARTLDFEWDDLDDRIEAAAGKSIAAIFAEDGETAFRDLESRQLSELCGRRRTVFALGGGTLGRSENRELVKTSGPVIWLTAMVDTIYERMTGDPTTAARRPNLTPIGGRSEIEMLLDERTPHYRECATLTIDTEGKTVAEIAAEIVRRLARQ
jgi:shikimate kinase